MLSWSEKGFLGAASDFMMRELAPSPQKSDKCEFVDVLALVSAQAKPETEARAIFRADCECERAEF